MLEASVSVWNKFGDLKLEAASSSILVQKTFYFMWHTDTRPGTWSNENLLLVILM